MFRLGAPTPVECFLSAGPGAVGAPRQCVSDRGVVYQRITEWSPPARLAFRMELTDLPFASCVSAMSDTFELTPAAGGRATQLTRSTRVDVRGRLRWARAVAVWIGLKAVHRFVFGDWRR
ncbi:hypothetical protein ACSNN7_00605 [Micromonospora sp. URMC 105]|uniref:hypothetical protein n=1 Tax=Micromonospora sp. URMC 105 TaxID=3423413 RepID=UPI003F1D8805